MAVELENSMNLQTTMQTDGASDAGASDTGTSDGPQAAAAGERALADFSDGDSGLVSQQEYERRLGEGLQEAFNADDDDTDEDLQPIEDAAGNRRRDKTPGDREAGEADDPEADADESAPREPGKQKAAAESEEAPSDEEASDRDPARAALEEKARQYKLDVGLFSDTASLAASVAAIDRMYHDVGEVELAADVGAPPDSDRGAPVDRPADRPADRSIDRDRSERREPARRASEFKIDRLNRSEYAPELIEALDEMRNVIADLRAENHGERERRMEAAALATEREIDSFFTELSQDNPVWRELFGTASGGELRGTTEGRKLFENRMSVLRARDNYAAGLESRRQPTPASRKLLESGLALAFREKLGEAAERKLARKLQGRHAGAPPRPTQRQSPRREGGSALREALKRNGMSPQQED